MLGLVQGGERVEYVLPVHAVAAEGIYGEVAHAERGEVLEEVGSLAGIHLEGVQSGLHYHLRRADVRPFDGNPEPGVAASPPAGSHQDVAALLFACLPVGVGRGGVAQKDAVDALYLPGYRRVVAWRVAVGLDVDDVLYVREDTLPDGAVRTQQAVCVGDVAEVFVQFHPVVHHGAYLQHVELSRLVGV